MNERKRERNAQERHPFDILNQAHNEILLPNPTVYDKILYPTFPTPKNNTTVCEPNLERVHVKVVDGELTASKQTIIDGRDRDRARNAVVREYVRRQHADLVVERRVAPDEPVDLLRDGPAGEPADEGVEEQLGAPVRVFLPPVELVVDRERDTLLEAAEGVRRPADDVAAETHGHVVGCRSLRSLRIRERLGPDLLELVGGVDEGGVLDGLPAEEGVVTDEESDLTIAASYGRGEQKHTIGRKDEEHIPESDEVHDTVLNVIVRHLHACMTSTNVPPAHQQPVLITPKPQNEKTYHTHAE